MVFSFQLLLAVMICVFLVNTIVRFIRAETFQSFVKFFVTFGVWSVALFLILFPQMAREISQALHLGSNLNTLIFLGFIVVLALIFRLIRIMERIERDITSLVRSGAVRPVVERDREK